MDKPLAIALLVVLALSGCASAGAASEDVGNGPSYLTDPVESATPTSEPTPTVDEETERYLRFFDTAWTGERPTDVELLAMGENACAQMRAGAQPIEVVVTDPTNNGAMLVAAVGILCPEFAP